jgi:hypothetical protein
MEAHAPARGEEVQMSDSAEMKMLQIAVDGLLAKTGGHAKLLELRAAIVGVPAKKRAAFVRGAAKTDEGAHQPLAYVLLGLVAADVLGKQSPSRGGTHGR